MINISNFGSIALRTFTDFISPIYSQERMRHLHAQNITSKTELQSKTDFRFP